MGIDPKDAKPDQPYEVDLGEERYVAMRNNPRQEHSEWRLLPELGVQALWAGDGAVKNLVPLVPARQVTRDDLPSAANATGWGVLTADEQHLVHKALDGVVAHLNANGGVPTESREWKYEDMPHCIVDWSGAFPSSLELSRKQRENLARYLNGKLGRSFPHNSTHAGSSGKSCCEDAAQSAAEVDRLTRERDEAREQRTRYREERDEQWRGRVKAEAERDELQAKLNAAERERDEVRDLAGRNTAKVAVLADERDDLQRKLDDLTMTVKELAPAEQRPTLDREAVRKVVGKHCGALGGYYMNMLVNDLMALVPAAEGWPEWLGSRPVLRVPVRNVDDNWTFHDGNGCIDGDVSEQSCREAIEDRLADAVKWAGILSAIESEQAATADEDQRVEEHAKALAAALINNRGTRTWDDLSGASRDVYRAAIRAGWTPPESEASE